MGEKTMPTSRDVAAAAGVSQATVSRALNQPNSVSPQTREKIEAAIKRLGYHPHSGAVAMKTQRTHTIGIVVSELSNPFFQEIFETLSDEFTKAGSRVIVWNSSMHESDAIRALQERSVDGIIISAWDEHFSGMRDALGTGLPVVLLNRTAPLGDFDSVTSDNRAGGALVAQYLYQNDKSELVFVQGKPETSTSAERLTGFQLELRRLGKPTPQIINGDFSFEATVLATQTYLKKFGLPDAFFCANDFMAFAVINALSAEDISVPNDVWVIGFDDVQQSSWPIFDLTTIRQDSQRMAQLGAQRLLSRIENPDSTPIREKLPVGLAVRGSTANTLFQ